MPLADIHTHSDWSNFRLRDSTNKIEKMIEYAHSLGFERKDKKRKFHIITQAPIGTVLTIIQQVKDMDINMRTVSDIEDVIIKLNNLGYPSYYQKLSVIDL